MLLPASTGSGESDFVSVRLDAVYDVVRWLEFRCVVFRSNTPEVVLAVLEMLVVREESTLTTRVTDLLAPLVIVVRFHPTTPARSEERRVGEEWSVPGGLSSDRIKRVSSYGRVLVFASVW